MDAREAPPLAGEVQRGRLSRRRLLRLGTLISLGALVALTACGEEEGDDEEDDD